MNTDTNNDTAKKAAGWVTNLLTGWGVPGTIARYIAVAIIGALIAIWTMMSAGCTATYKQTAGGDISYTGSLNPLPVEVLDEDCTK